MFRYASWMLSFNSDIKYYQSHWTDSGSSRRSASLIPKTNTAPTMSRKCRASTLLTGWLYVRAKDLADRNPDQGGRGLLTPNRQTLGIGAILVTYIVGQLAWDGHGYLVVPPVKLMV